MRVDLTPQTADPEHNSAPFLAYVREPRSDGEQLGFLAVSDTLKDEPENIFRTLSNGMKEASEGIIVLPKSLQLLLQGEKIVV